MKNILRTMLLKLANKMEKFIISVPQNEFDNFVKYQKTTRFDAVFEGNTIGKVRMIRTLNQFYLLEFINNAGTKFYVYDTYGVLNNWEFPFGLRFSLEGNNFIMDLPKGIFD